MTRFDELFLADLHRYSDKSSPRAVVGSLLRNPGYAACILLRMQALAVERSVYVLPGVLRYLGLAFFGFDSVPGSRIGKGLLLPHPSGVVIGKGVVIGENATILQHVTFGERHLDGSGSHGYPRVGDNVVVGAGAKVLGSVLVNDGVTIGANSVVLSDCPPNSVVVGLPARVVKVSDYAPGRVTLDGSR